MLEIGLLVVASLLAAAGALVLALGARAGGGGAGAGAGGGSAEATHARRDDAIVGLVAALALGVTVALGHPRGAFSRASIVAAAWTAGACAAGALGMLAARAARDASRRVAAGTVSGARARVRWEASAAAAVAEQSGIVLALGLLVAVASAAAGVLSDPQRLATQVPEMITGFAVGSAVVGIGSMWSEGEAVASEIATTACGAMVLASYFFDANAGLLRSAPSSASALGLVVFPVVVLALGALGSAVAAALSLRLLPPSRDGAASAGMELESRALPLAALLVLPAAWGAAAALLGWLWEPFALCATMGVAATLLPHLLARRLARTPWMDAAALAALAIAALVSWAVARHSGLVHAGPLGLATAATAAQGSTLLARAAARAGERASARDHEGASDGGTESPSASAPEIHESATLADRQAAALAAITIGLAVLDGATLFRCTRFAHAAAGPTADTASMLAHCALASVAPSRIDVANPATLLAALAALVLGATARPDAALLRRARSLVVAILAVAATALIAHYGFGVGLEAVAAAALALMLGSALFPGVFHRPTAHLVAATALALGAVVG